MHNEKNINHFSKRLSCCINWRLHEHFFFACKQLFFHRWKDYYLSHSHRKHIFLSGKSFQTIFSTVDWSLEFFMSVTMWFVFINTHQTHSKFKFDIIILSRHVVENYTRIRAQTIKWSSFLTRETKAKAFPIIYLPKIDCRTITSIIFTIRKRRCISNWCFLHINYTRWIVLVTIDRNSEWKQKNICLIVDAFDGCWVEGDNQATNTENEIELLIQTSKREVKTRPHAILTKRLCHVAFN